MVDPQFGLDVITDDPDDNRILECAVAASASYIISGDDHLLALEKYKGIVVLPPAGFLASEMLAAYYQSRQWNPQTGYPASEKLSALGLTWLLDDLPDS